MLRSLAKISLLIGSLAHVGGAIYVNALFQNYEFPSVNYFDVSQTRWPYFDQILNGHVAVLPTLNLDVLDFTPPPPTTGNETDDPYEYLDIDLDEWRQTPKFLVVDFGESHSFAENMHNASVSAEKMGADFVVIIRNGSWFASVCFNGSLPSKSI